MAVQPLYRADPFSDAGDLESSLDSLTRFTADCPCPVCGGYESLPRGRGERCGGFLSSDHQYAHCTRDDHAGDLPLRENSQTYAHRLNSECACGCRHNLTLARFNVPASSGPHRRIVAIYSYQGAAGNLLFQVVRLDPKDFRQRRPGGPDGWTWDLAGVQLVPYRLPELLAANTGEPVIVVEGEQDADQLINLGFVATTNAMGAGKWRQEYSLALRDRHVAIIGDNDEPGHRHARKVAESLSGVSADVKVIDLPGLPDRGDVSDWLAAGHDAEELRALIEGTPFWEPPASESKKTADNDAASAPGVPRLRDEALFGLAGDIVRAIEPQTEAHRAALLINVLVYFGNAVGKTPHAMVGDKNHPLNLFAVLVGRTSGGRKGTSRGSVDALFRRVDSDWRQQRVKQGLSSGEGLIHSVRDPVEKINKRGQREVVDEGEPDKRLLAVEEEFCGTVKIMARQGNTLSATIRQAWDGDDLSTLTRNNPMRATEPHVSILGHSTQQELFKYLTDTEMGNGFANRFLWVYVERSKCLPDGGEPVEFGDITERLAAALEFGRRCAAPVQRDAEARAAWHQLYPNLTADRPGLFGAVTSRAEAQVLRLSAIYAIMDCSAVVRPPHLRAAVALWQYCENSASYIFGAATGNAIADRILAALKDAGAEGLDTEAIYRLFQGNVPAARYNTALKQLETSGRITKRSEKGTGGRDRVVFTLR